MIIQPRKRTGEYNIEVEQENTSYRENSIIQPRKRTEGYQPTEKTGESYLEREQENATYREKTGEYIPER